MRNHRKLRAFELADELAVEIYAATRSFPREETFGLTSQMRRAAVSVASNVVEGCARRTEGDYLHFLDMSFGSLRELDYQITLASRLGFFVESNSLQNRCSETLKVMHGLISSLRKDQR